jgi:hypothetical protein
MATNVVIDNTVTTRPRDIDWIKQSFLLADDDITEADMLRRVMTSATFKFTDTSLGGNFCINPPPQFTRYADIKTGGGARASDNTEGRRDYFGGIDPVAIYAGIRDDYKSMKSRLASGFGMGRYYSEAIDDHNQLVHMRFGVPEFNSMWAFLGSMYSTDASQLARTGRSTYDFFSAPIQSTAGAAGAVTGLLLAAPFYPFILGGKVIRTLAGWPTTKYYYLKPTMALYRNAVNQIANGIAVNMGLSPYSPKDTRRDSYADQTVFGDAYLKSFNGLLPDVIGTDGVVDVYKLSTRAQRRAEAYREDLRALNGSGVASTFQSLRSSLREHMNNIANGVSGNTPAAEGRGLAKYLQDYFAISNNKKLDNGGMAQEQVGDRTQYSMASAGDVEPGKTNADGSMTLGERAGAFSSFFGSELRDGGQFVTFRVDNPGTQSESFSNSVRESDLASQLNSTSANARSKRFSFANGDLDPYGITKTISGAMESFVTEALDKVQLSGLAAFSGLAFTDIPKVYDASSAQLPTSDFTIQLRTPYNNKMSRFLHLYLPLAHLLAGVLPLSTGAKSYTSPFLVECYSVGRCAIRLGIIQSMTITRGTGNVGWSENGEPMGIDVSFSVADLSTIVHMPIVSKFSLWSKAWMGAASTAGAINDNNLAAVGVDSNGALQNSAEAVAAALSASTYDDDNSYTDYLAVLGSLTLPEMTYGTRKIALQYANRRQDFRTWATMGQFASTFSDTMLGRGLRAFAMASDRGVTP